MGGRGKGRKEAYLRQYMFEASITALSQPAAPPSARLGSNCQYLKDKSTII